MDMMDIWSSTMLPRGGCDATACASSSHHLISFGSSTKYCLLKPADTPLMRRSFSLCREPDSRACVRCLADEESMGRV